MTVSTHVYAATLTGTPDRELSLRRGTITLDAGGAPHVTASLEIAIPDAATLDALDPRKSPRVEIRADAVTPAGAQSRTFDLGLRRRDVHHAEGTVALTLASDEALLTDYAFLLEDTSQVTATSLRAVIDYMLDKAVPGASLAAHPVIDAPVTAFWPVTNLISNPSFATGITGWGSGQGASSLTWVNFGGNGALGWTAAAGVSNVIAAPTLTTFRVTPGQSYVFVAYIRSSVAGRSASAAIQWRTGGGATTHATVYGSSILTVTGSFSRVYVIATAPAGADYCQPFVTTAGNVAGDLHYVDTALFYEGRFLIPIFDGATADSDTYRYDWSDPLKPNASSSIRTPTLTRDPESLVIAAGQTILNYLAPLVQVAGLRLVCDESRAWTLRPEQYRAPGALTVRHAVNLIDGVDGIDRDSEVWFDAAVTNYTWTDRAGTQQKRTDSYALTEPHTRLVTFERDTPYPGPGFSQYAVRRAQGRGREVSATTVADWTARAEQEVTIVLDGAPTQLGGVQRVAFDLDRDEMTITTRTTDTPAGAIDLLAGTIDALAGTIDALT